MKSIKSKVGLILLGVFALVGASNYAIQKSVTFPSFIDLERDEAQKDLDRCVGAIKREIHHLDSLCHDWAAWNDTYDFVESPSKEYLEANLVLSTFTDSGVNLIYVIDITGKVVWGEIHDLETEETMILADFSKDSFPTTHPLIRLKTGKRPLADKNVTGVFMTEQGPMLIASRPILNSNNEGPIRGSLIMGRFLNHRVVKTLVEQAEVAFEVFPIQGGSLPEDISKISNRFTPESPYLIENKGDEALLIYTKHPDIKGEQGLLIRAKIPRKISAKGYATIRYALISILISALGVLIVMLLLLQRTVLKPIVDLTDHALSVKKTGDLSVRLSIPRHDEIGTLANEFDGMLEKLDERTTHLNMANEHLKLEIEERRQAEEALRESKERMETILDSMPVGIAIIDEKTREIIDVNPQAVLMVHALREQIIGSKCYQIFGSAEKGKCPLSDPGKKCDKSEHTLNGKDGKSIPIHKTAIPVTVDGITCYIECFFDITDQKRVEYERLKKEKLEGIIEMAGAVCHELNQPLQGVSGYSELLMMDMEEGDQSFQIICRIKGEIDRMGEITKKLMKVTEYKTKDYLKGKIIDIDKASLGG